MPFEGSWCRQVTASPCLGSRDSHSDWHRLSLSLDISLSDPSAGKYAEKTVLRKLRTNDLDLLPDWLRSWLVGRRVVGGSCFNCFKHLRRYFCKPLRKRVLRFLQDEDSLAEVL